MNFWYQEYFHGVNLSSLRSAALTEYFRQPIVDTFDVNICTAKTMRHVIDFQTAHETDLHRIEIPIEFHMLQTGTVHGIAFWFDVAFIGTTNTVWLSTAPTQPLTHWYQVTFRHLSQVKLERKTVLWRLNCFIFIGAMSPLGATLC